MLTTRNDEVISISDDDFYVEHSHAGAFDKYCLHFTFRTIAKAKDFFVRLVICDFPVVIEENQVIVLPAKDSVSPGVWLHDANTIYFTCGSDIDEDYQFNLIEYINNHAKDWAGNNMNNILMLCGRIEIHEDFIKSKLFSLVERIKRIENYYTHAAFLLFTLKNLFESEFYFPNELIQTIFSLVNTMNLDKTFPLPKKIMDKYKRTDCFLERDDWRSEIHLICPDNTEATQLFSLLDNNKDDKLKIALDYNEILIKVYDRNAHSGIICLSGNTHHKLFFFEHINFFVKTEKNPRLPVMLTDNYFFSFSKENLRVRSRDEITLFVDIIHPILAFIDTDIIARLRGGEETKAISGWNNFCNYFVDNKNSIDTYEKIRKMKIACLIDLKDQISEGLRIRIPLEEIINNWYQTKLTGMGGKTVSEIIHLDRKNNACDKTGTSDCINMLLVTFSEQCKTVLADDPDRACKDWDQKYWKLGK